MTSSKKHPTSTAGEATQSGAARPMHGRTASGSASTTLLRSVFSTTEDVNRVAAAPRSGPAWFGSLNSAAAQEMAAAAHRRGPGMLKSPAELGHAAPDKQEEKAKEMESTDGSQKKRVSKTVQASPTVVGMRQRKQALQQSIAAAWQQEEAMWLELAKDQSEQPSYVTAFTYQGMEVWIGTHRNIAFLCLARTLMVLQTLTMESDDTIVAVRSHPTTGQVVLVGGKTGTLQVYRPEKCSPTDVSSGVYRWKPWTVIRVRELLGGEADQNDKAPLLVSCSSNWKVLVATGHHLAVWDTLNQDTLQVENPEASVVWMTRLPAPVQAAAMAGDGQALAVVLKSTEDDEADGVHTFERDWDDGATATNNPAYAAQSTERSPSDLSATSSGNVGMVYKPGPFLVHSAPVVRLSFRGGGSCNSRLASTSAVDSSLEEDAANDLLLTTANDGTARIFGQQGWKPLTEWVCGKQTRVDWIRGQAAFSLGDLEARQVTSKKSKTASRSVSRQSSAEGNVVVAALGGQTQSPHSIQQRMPAIPAHTTPLSQAGAWIAEVSWEISDDDVEVEDDHGESVNPDRLPWISLSRLTYLKRGTGDLTPTLLESVSTILPPVSVMKASVMTRMDDSLMVEGLWPAWNPFVDVPTEMSSASPVETLRGSAMAFLGLAQTDGYFGDALLQGTQCPPTELRLVASHPLSGHVVILEFNLHGQDKNLNALELGAPMRSLVNLAAMTLDGKFSSKINIGTESIAITDHGKGKLWAAVPDGQRIQLHWRQPGTQSIMPSQWLSTDIFSSANTVASILQGTQRFRDESLLPVPLALRPLPAASPEDPVKLIQWWPERIETLQLHGPRLLIAWKRSGSAVVLEMLPPLAERTIPEDGSGSLTYQKRSEAQYLQRQGSSRFRRRRTFSDSDGNGGTEEYEVSITPDAQYGLGLRLESLDDGEPAIAGSFKKNPDNGEDLPAERTGMIVLGDELVSANGVNLEDRTFDDIINTVREFGASASPGNPIRMRFRRKGPRRDRASSASSTDAAAKRRTMEQMFGVSRETVDHKRLGHSHSTGTVSSLDNSVEGAASAMPSGDPCLFAQLAPLGGFSKVLARENAERRVLLVADQSKVVSGHAAPSTLFVCVDEENIEVHRLTLPHTRLGEVECQSLGSWRLRGIQTLDLVKADSKELLLLAVCNDDIQLVVVSLKNIDQVQFSASILSKQAPAEPEACIVRTHSLQFLATSESEDGKYTSINVWTPKLHPGCNVSEETVNTESNDCEAYYRATINVEAGLRMDDHFVDFCFVHSGFFDCSPLLLTFSMEGIQAYQQRGGSFDWLLVSTIVYEYNLGSLPALQWHPLACLPHLPSTLRAFLSSHDEDNFLRSDWHPDALIAQLCTNENGVRSALETRISCLFEWLVTGEGKELLEDFHHLPLLCADPPDQDPGYEYQCRANAGLGLFGVGPSFLSGRQDEKTVQLTSFRDKMVKYLRTPKGEANSDVLWLSSMKRHDVKILLAVLEIFLNPPPFQKVDTCGELYLFASALLTHFAATEEAKEKKVYSFQVPGVLKRQDSSFSNNRSTAGKATTFIASAACLSGLVSASQDMIVDAVKGDCLKFDWTYARQLRIPLWLRSDTSLAAVAEDIGQTIFREKRDIMECAIFFIIARKMRKLRNLAATDRSDSGTKFFKFITTHDFSSERGRRAAEKNAFSLLRKCRYQVSSAFFLLSEPPALQSALETIVTKMQDPDLAFMVARLMESQEVKSDAGSGGPSSAGLLGFGGVLGGGGGYAGGAIVESKKANASDSEKFERWKPSCGRMTKKLLVERLLPSFSSNAALSSIVLHWLGKREEAAWWLSGFLEASPSAPSGYRLVSDARSRFFEKLKDPPQSEMESQNQIAIAALHKVNSLIDFTSSPWLLQHMKSSLRSRFASSLLVYEAMIVRGVDTPSLWALIKSLPADEVDEPENLNNFEMVASGGVAQLSVSPALQTGSNPQSSIFDDFDTVAAVNKKPQSSIFDDFDPPPISSRKKPISHPASSIFDSFDQRHPAAGGAAKTDAVAQSSIFDSFDVPPQATGKSSFAEATPKAESSVTPSSGAPTVSSSIFDSYDAPPQTRKPTSAEVTVKPESSIFDAFEVPVPVKKNPPSSLMRTMSLLEHRVGPMFDLYKHEHQQFKPPKLRLTEATWSKGKKTASHYHRVACHLSPTSIYTLLKRGYLLCGDYSVKKRCWWGLASPLPKDCDSTFLISW